MVAAGLYFIGICMAVASGATTALSMVIQRFALSHPDDKIPLRACGRPLNISLGRNVVWVGGLVVYGIGTGGLYSVAGLWIPLTLLTCLFITLLVFNLYFSRYFLNEPLTRPTVMGSFVVLGGTCFCAVGASIGSPGVPTEYTSDEIAKLYSAPLGAIWFSLLVTSTLGSLILIFMYERKYPLRADGLSNKAPAWIDRLMGVVYPASLGLDEAVAHLTLRCMNAMLSVCDKGECSNPIFPVTIVLWAISSIATALWLRVVYQRYEVTRALPVEYGATAVADVASGLIFFQEYKYFDAWRYPLIIGGMVLTVIGIAVGRGLNCRLSTGANRLEMRSPTSPQRQQSPGASPFSSPSTYTSGSPSSTSSSPASLLQSETSSM